MLASLFVIEYNKKYEEVSGIYFSVIGSKCLWF